MIFYDIHTHHPKIADTEEKNIRNNSIIQIQNTYPFDIDSKQNSFITNYFSCGIHPWYPEGFDDQLNILTKIAKNDSLVAIGEAGLDKLRGLELRQQEIIFEKQVHISEECHKPMIIHCVKSWSEIIAIKKKLKPKQPWIIHGYRGNKNLTLELIHHGFMFSIGEKFNPEALEKIPRDSFFCETDDSPMGIKLIYESVSKTLNMQLEVLAEIISMNIKNTFPTLYTDRF